MTTFCFMYGTSQGWTNPLARRPGQAENRFGQSQIYRPIVRGLSRFSNADQLNLERNNQNHSLLAARAYQITIIVTSILQNNTVLTSVLIRSSSPVTLLLGFPYCKYGPIRTRRFVKLPNQNYPIDLLRSNNVYMSTVVVLLIMLLISVIKWYNRVKIEVWQYTSEVSYCYINCNKNLLILYVKSSLNGWHWTC